MSTPRRLFALVLVALFASLFGLRSAALEMVPILPVEPLPVAESTGPNALHDKPSAGEALVGVFEYVNEDASAYFVTASPEDLDALESGRIPGWKRTQAAEIFMAFRNPGYFGRSSAPQPVCRYFIPPHSHFMSASKAECDAVGAEHPDFVLETRAAFHAWLPNAVTGECPAILLKAGGPLFRPVYRLWNGQADTSHRFTTSLAVRAEMMARGWIPEGYGPLGVAMCAPLFAG